MINYCIKQVTGGRTIFPEIKLIMFNKRLNKGECELIPLVNVARKTISGSSVDTEDPNTERFLGSCVIHPGGNVSISGPSDIGSLEWDGVPQTIAGMLFQGAYRVYANTPASMTYVTAVSRSLYRDGTIRRINLLPGEQYVAADNDVAVVNIIGNSTLDGEAIPVQSGCFINTGNTIVATTQSEFCLVTRK